MTAFVKELLHGERRTPPDDLFGFLRSCEFNIPEMVGCIGKSIRANRQSTAGYSLFVGRLENWFLEESIKSLEEIGFPIVLFERLALSPRPGLSVDGVLSLASARASARTDLTAVEIGIVEDVSVRRPSAVLDPAKRPNS